jgi:hypothetical protein
MGRLAECPPEWSPAGDGATGIRLARQGRMKKMRWSSLLLLGAAALLVMGCASLEGTTSMVRAPLVRPSTEQPAELSFTRAGAGTVKAWARVKNPNDFPITLTKVHGILFLADHKAARLDVETKLDMKAREEATVPLEMPFGGKEKDATVAVGGQAGSAVPYRFDGKLSVTAHENVETVFGPLTLLEGQARVR